MSDVVVKNHIYDFMRSENVVEAQQAIGVSSSTELSSVEIRIDAIETDYNTNKPIWNGTFTTVQANSATWAGGSTDSIVIANSANWNNTYTTVQSNSAKWNPIYVNVKDYGASGNGVANDYLSIRTAFAALTSNGGGILFFPSGNYMINSALEIQDSAMPITIMGSGPSSIVTAMSGLTSTNTGNYPMFYALRSSNILIENITFDCRGDTQPFPLSSGLPLLYNRAKNKCFAFQYCKDINIQGVNFLNTQQTNEFTSCSSVKIHNSNFKNCTYRFPSTGLLGVYTGLYYPDAPSTQIYASGSSHIGFGTCIDVKIDQCYFEGWQYDAIAHTVTDTSPCKNFEVNDCTFYNISGSAFAIECFRTGEQYLENQKFIGNTFINSKNNEYSAGTGISNSGKDIIVSNNSWFDYALSGVDSWRIGLELTGTGIVISNNIFNNSQLHLSNLYNPIIIEGTINNNYIVSGNIFNSNRATTGGNATLVINSTLSGGDNIKINDNVFTYLSGMGYRAISVSYGNNISIDNNIFKKPLTPSTEDAGTAISMNNVEKVRITNNTIENFGIGINLPPSNPYKIRNFYIKDNLLKNSGASYIGEQNIQYGMYNSSGDIAYYNIQSLSTLSLSSYFRISENDVFVRGTGVYPRSKIIILNIRNPIELSQTIVYNNTTYKLSSFDIVYNSSNDFHIGEQNPASRLYQYNEESFFGGNSLNYSLSSKNILMSENYSGYNVGMISEMIVITPTSYSDSSKILLPANSIIKSVVANISLPPDGVTSFDIGTASSTTRFLSGLTNTRDTKKVGLLHIPNNTVQSVDERLRITPNTTPLSAGLVNVSIFYETFDAPRD